MSQDLAMQREWARRGALVRLEEMEAERSRILASFPEFSRGRGDSVRARNGAGLRQRRKMSAAARRRMSAGMKKYWARRRAKSSGKTRAEQQNA